MQDLPATYKMFERHVVTMSYVRDNMSKKNNVLLYRIKYGHKTNI